jgi:hypothetical protein
MQRYHLRRLVALRNATARRVAIIRPPTESSHLALFPSENGPSPVEGSRSGGACCSESTVLAGDGRTLAAPGVRVGPGVSVPAATVLVCEDGISAVRPGVRVEVGDDTGVSVAEDGGVEDG